MTHHHPFPSWPSFSENEISLVADVLRSGRVNSWTGSLTKQFEFDFSRFNQTTYSVAHSNGTLALTSAYYACGVRSGTEVITTPRSFVATASAASLLGGRVKFADVDPNSGNITAATIEPLITPLTKCISVVHLAGWPADMASIRELALHHHIHVVEDCSQAHGARINGVSVGSFSDVSTWSFCQDKIISTGGEGGMVSTSNKRIFDIVWSLKDHGKNKTKLDQPASSSFRYVHDTLGSNFRLTEMQSAIGISQLTKLDKWHAVRTANARILTEHLNDLYVVDVPLPSDGFVHAWYKFYAYLNLSCLRSDWTRDRIISEISALGFPAFSGSCSEIYKEKAFAEHQGQHPLLPNAYSLGLRSLLFLVHPTIDESTMMIYSTVVRSVLLRAQN